MDNWDVVDQARELARRGGEFAPWVEREREDQRMRNDDVALVHIDFG